MEESCATEGVQKSSFIDNALLVIVLPIEVCCALPPSVDVVSLPLMGLLFHFYFFMLFPTQLDMDRLSNYKKNIVDLWDYGR